MTQKRLLIGITGASGAPLALELLRQMQEIPQIETHVILSQCGELTLTHETGLTREDLRSLCTCLYDNQDYGAGPASGSFEALGMVAGLRGSSSGIPASTLPTRSAPTSAALV